MKKGTGTYITSLVVVLFFVMIAVSGGTYAYWQWTSAAENNKNVVFNTSKEISNYIVYDEGDSYFIGDFQPESSFCQSINTTLSFYKTSDIANVRVIASIYMDVNSVGTNIAASDSVYWLITEGDNTISCDEGLDTSTIINYGTFKGATAGSSKTLVSEIEVETTVKEFTVWIWMDSNGENLSSLSGETVDTNIWTQFTQIDADSYNGPTLDEGMIPVTLSSTGVVTTISKTDSNWYDYENKQWANAVLVDDDSRSTYKNTTGVTVNQDDILAYYVWIPRYKYKIWTIENSSAGSEQTIDIVFESSSEAMSLGTAVGEYRTHPAFWWDNDSDGTVDLGETVAGIWVGKFETSANTDSTCYTSNSITNCVSTNVSPRIVPNVNSLRYQDVSTQFTTSQKFSASSNIYGLSSTSTNAHMMKNSEWGAVAYLSHSIYGINNEIRINNNNSFITGCGASTENGSATTSCEIGYNSETTPQSTTGNITGVFDMSGGAWEYVMGNYNNTIGYSGIGTFPASKYYDKYTTAVSTTACNGGICYGHALSETSGWYSDYADVVVYSGSPWFLRDGSFEGGASAGAFSSVVSSGVAGYHTSWRSVLVVGYGA